MDEHKEFIDGMLERLKKCKTERQARNVLLKVYDKGFDKGWVISLRNNYGGI